MWRFHPGAAALIPACLNRSARSVNIRIAKHRGGEKAGRPPSSLTASSTITPTVPPHSNVCYKPMTSCSSYDSLVIGQLAVTAGCGWRTEAGGSPCCSAMMTTRMRRMRCLAASVAVCVEAEEHTVWPHLLLRGSVSWQLQHDNHRPHSASSTRKITQRTHTRAPARPTQEDLVEKKSLLIFLVGQLTTKEAQISS